MNRVLIKKYRGFSLIETLLTIVIMAVILMLVSVTLTTMLKVSAISTAKTTSRDESEFIMEIIKRNIANSDPADISLFNVTTRSVNVANGAIIDSNPTLTVTAYSNPVATNVAANEIHIRPHGSDRWVCIAAFPDSTDNTKLYLMKTSAKNLNGTHQTCFDSNPLNNPDYIKYTMFLNSDNVKVKTFDIKYFSSSENVFFAFELTLEPKYWIAGPNSSLKPQYFKQMVVSSQKLTWGY